MYNLHTKVNKASIREKCALESIFYATNYFIYEVLRILWANGNETWFHVLLQ